MSGKWYAFLNYILSTKGGKLEKIYDFNHCSIFNELELEIEPSYALEMVQKDY